MQFDNDTSRAAARLALAAEIFEKRVQKQPWEPEEDARLAVEAADALLAALERSPALEAPTSPPAVPETLAEKVKERGRIVRFVKLVGRLVPFVVDSIELAKDAGEDPDDIQSARDAVEDAYALCAEVGYALPEAPPRPAAKEDSY